MMTSCTTVPSWFAHGAPKPDIRAMTTREVINWVAARRGIDPESLVEKRSRATPRAVYARIEVAKILNARGYSTARIAVILGRDHTTIVYYLGRAKKRPKPEPSFDWRPKWKRPRVRHREWLIARPKHSSRYLVPYAGADWTQYQWRKRANGQDADQQG